jgi:bifunctional polynucleotide phosphatase/kinase
VLAATAKDGYRKPMDGMFKLVQQIYREHGMEIGKRMNGKVVTMCRHQNLMTLAGRTDRGSSFFVGDAAGRPRRGNRERDHSDTDLKWALNVGIQFYTPEQHFQGLLDDVERHLQGFNASAWLDTQGEVGRSAASLSLST